MIRLEEIPIKIQYQITEEDYIQFNLHYLENSPSQKKNYNLLRYLIPIIFSVPVYAIGTVLFKQPKEYWIVIAILFIVIWILRYPKMYIRLVEKQTKKLLDEGDNSSVFGKKTMVIYEDHFEVSDGIGTETVSKNSIKDIKVHEDMVLIYLSAFSAEIIPTRFLDEETKTSLLEQLKG